MARLKEILFKELLYLFVIKGTKTLVSKVKGNLSYFFILDLSLHSLFLVQTAGEKPISTLAKHPSFKVKRVRSIYVVTHF